MKNEETFVVAAVRFVRPDWIRTNRTQFGVSVFVQQQLLVHIGRSGQPHCA
jgi:hypothetical protein